MVKVFKESHEKDFERLAVDRRHGVFTDDDDTYRKTQVVFSYGGQEVGRRKGVEEVVVRELQEANLLSSP